MLLVAKCVYMCVQELRSLSCLNTQVRTNSALPWFTGNLYSQYLPCRQKTPCGGRAGLLAVSEGPVSELAPHAL